MMSGSKDILTIDKERFSKKMKEKPDE